MNPSPLTGERLAIILEYRYAFFFFFNPHQRVLQFGPASGSPHETRGHIMTAAFYPLYFCIFPPSRNDKAPTFPPGLFYSLCRHLKLRQHIKVDSNMTHLIDFCKTLLRKSRLLL